MFYLHLYNVQLIKLLKVVKIVFTFNKVFRSPPVTTWREDIKVPPQKKLAGCICKFISATSHGKSPLLKSCPWYIRTFLSILVFKFVRISANVTHAKHEKIITENILYARVNRVLLCSDLDPET